jgi:hypothetical protein
VSVDEEEFTGLFELLLFELLLFNELELELSFDELLQAAATKTSRAKASNEFNFFIWGAPCDRTYPAGCSSKGLRSNQSWRRHKTGPLTSSSVLPSASADFFQKKLIALPESPIHEPGKNAGDQIDNQDDKVDTFDLLFIDRSERLTHGALLTEDTD